MVAKQRKTTAGKTGARSRKQDSSYDVVVIGAGCGGITAASLLAKEGRRVLLLEQSDLVGGCCTTVDVKGYKFDLGASIIEDAEVIDLAFQRLGSSLGSEVKLIACDPVYEAILSDGTRMRYPLNTDATAREIGRVSPPDEFGWKRYAKKMKSFVDTALRGFFIMPAGTLGQLFRIFRKTPGLLKFGSLFVGSYQGIIQKYFQDARVQESISFQSFYVGLPPELAPAYFGMLPYSEHTGVHYTKGGMVGIPAALLKLGKKHGLDVRFRAEVRKILVHEGRVQGVRLADGEEIRASVVVSAINAKHMYLNLIGEEHLSWIVRKGLHSYEYSMATPMIYLGLDYKPPLRAHHTLVTVPTEQLNRYWNESYKKGKYPTEQFGIISWTTHSDPSLAPRGHHVVILTLAPGPYRLRDSNWDAEKKRLMKEIIHYYSEKYIPGLEDHVRVSEFSTPLDFERRLLSPEGAIYALRQDVLNATVFRPSAKSRSIKGLYLAGASTHPGGGVPTTICSGMIAADLIRENERVGA